LVLERERLLASYCVRVYIVAFMEKLREYIDIIQAPYNKCKEV